MDSTDQKVTGVTRILRLIGVILVLVLASVSLWRLFSQPKGPVTNLIDKHTVIIDSGDLNHPIRYKLAYHKYRADCPVSERVWLMTDSAGAQFTLESSKSGKGAGGLKTPDDVEFETQVQLLSPVDPQGISLGKAKVWGHVTYSCKEGVQTHPYPAKEFEITKLKDKP